MKQLFIILAIVLFASTMSPAQKKYSFGFEFAPHISWATSNTNRVDNESTAFGIKYGLRGDSFFGENYAITSGLMISHTTFHLQYHEDLDIETVDNTYTLNSGSTISYHFQYLEIPVGFKFQSNEIGYLRIMFEGGFMPGLRLRSKVSAKNDIHDIDKEEFKSGTSLLALSYYFEGGISYSLGAKVALKGTIFYSSGILDATTEDDREDDRITQNTLGLKLGLIF